MTDAATTAAAGIASTGDITSAIENLAPGTNLGTIGLSPSVLAAAGITNAGGLEGTGASYLSNLVGNQGGVYTPDQISAAQRGYTAINANDYTQIAALYGSVPSGGAPGSGIAGQESILATPGLTSTAYAAATTAIKGLVVQILGLQSTIQGNSDAMDKLTSATNKNTDATGQMTGSVGYSYQEQDYVAGGNFTSDSPSNVSVGL